jgi:serine/threonine protein kinase
MKIHDRYEYDPNQDLLGRGGFARVYRARDTLLHRDVALKVFGNAGGHRYSVLDEIRKVIGLEHPNLLRYYDVILLEVENNLGEKDQTQIGVMELANASDLKLFARANPGSPLLFKLLKDVLQGLEYLHGKGIIHRDIKAQNVLLVKQDGQLTAKISDFGISKDTGANGNSSSMMVGTVEYMAPEQFAPAKFGIDGKVASNLDLWSFGIMVHELLTDTTPFGNREGNTTVEQIMAQILSTELPQDIDRLPEPYRSVVRKCLVTNARERIRKASELVGYFDGPAATAPTIPASDGETKVYPKGGPAVPRDDDATKVYPKAGEPGAASRASDDATKVYGDAPRTPEPVAQSTHAAQGEPGRPKRKGVLVASIVGLVLVAGAGWWAMNEHRARLQAEAKAAVELAAAAEAKTQVETMAAAQAKSAAEATAAAAAKVRAEATAAAKAAAEAAQRKAEEERRKLVDERERREAEDRTRRATARVAEQPRIAHGEAAHGLQWAEADNGELIDWHAATRYCARKGSGWRLPTVAELQNNYKNGQSTRCSYATCQVSSNSRLTWMSFWSNEPNGPSEAWVVQLKDGTRSAYLAERINVHALCVRGP